MSFWTTLYEAGAALGKIQPSELNFEFPPLYHANKRGEVEICLSKKGEMESIRLIPIKEQTLDIIPVTAESSKRTQSAAKNPHPLCDNPSNMNEEYIELLGEWAKWSGSMFLIAVHRYVTSPQFRIDLVEHEVPMKAMIRWTVDGVNCTRSEDLMESWIRFYEQKTAKEAETDVCMITGEMDVVQEKGIKALVPGHANGKLFSSDALNQNTLDGNIRRGRFTGAKDAFNVGVKGAHYAQQALKWLCNHGGVDIGGSNFLCVFSPKAPGTSFAEALVSGSSAYEKATPFVYGKDALRQALFGNSFVRDTDEIVTMVVGGLTKGRLSLDYYQEGDGSKLLDSLDMWETFCSWERWDAETKQYVAYVPTLQNLVEFAFGVKTGGYYKVTQESKRNMWVRRLMRCKLEEKAMPKELVNALMFRAERREVYGDILLPTTLAVLRKWYVDKGEEEFTSMVDFETTDRSYLYGRLLAVYDKLEQDFLRKKRQTRTTNACKLQAAFAREPMKISQALDNKAKKIWLRNMSAGSQVYYQKMLTELWSSIAETGEDEKPLEPKYMFGYYAQRKELFRKK